MRTRSERAALDLCHFSVHFLEIGPDTSLEFGATANLANPVTVSPDAGFFFSWALFICI
jgi:hypothetical protein